MGLCHRDWRGHLAIGTTGLFSLFGPSGCYYRYVRHCRVFAKFWLIKYLVSIVVTIPMSNYVEKAQVAWIEKVQERLRTTSATLDDMKAVKLLGLSDIISNTIQKLRQAEIQTSKVYRKLFVWNVLLCKIPSRITLS
jgi:hypothetical protein